MKFDMGAAWRDAVALIGANREVMAIVAGVFFFLPSLAAVLLVPEMQPPVGADPEQVQAFLMEFYVANAPLFVLLGLVQAVGLLTLLSLLRDDSRPTVGDALKTALKGLLPYIGTQLIVAVGAVLILTVAVAVPAGLGMGPVAGILAVVALPIFLYVLIKLSLVTPVIAIEKQMNPIAILQRSWRLTKGNSVRLFLFYLLLGVVFLVAVLVISIVFGIVFALLGEGTAFMIANGILSGLMGAAGTLIFSAILAATHRQLAGPSSDRLGETFE